MAYFPFLTDISEKRCLVVGGGRIAFQKVKILRDFGVKIRVVAEEIGEEVRALKKESMSGSQTLPIEIWERNFVKEDILGMDFVIAATDNEELNHAVSKLCRENRIPVNAVDKKEDCDFIFPALIRKGDILVAVSTGGSSPAAAAFLKQRISCCIPEYYGGMVERLGEYREEIKEQVADAGARKELFYRLLSYGEAHDGEIPEQVMRELLMEYARNSEGI